ncbi:MAG: YceI family protein [Bacteroidales bacterium]|nr:YceI family protein [Bacteroidales bacterium]
MKNRVIRVLMLIIAVTALTSYGKYYELSKEGNEILINGTSNLHDWTMNVVESSCEAEFDTQGLRLISINKVIFSCKPTDIKSNSNLMDRKTYEALKAENFPVIKFSLSSGTEIKSDNRRFSGNLKGTLLVAGVTRVVEIPFTGLVNDDNSLRVEGAVDLKMSDFKISPPTALLGTLKTGDNISVSFSLKLLSKS